MPVSDDAATRAAREIEEMILHLWQTIGFSPRPLPSKEIMAAKIRRHCGDGEDGAKARWYYDLAKEMARRWRDEVEQRPDVNIYRAGMDKAYKAVEAWALREHERHAARAAQSEGERDGNQEQSR